MPNTASAAKNVRKSAKLNALNRWRKTEVRTAIKDFTAALQAGNVEEAEKQVNGLYALLDKVSTTSTYHKNTTSRYKSRLTKRLNALKSAKKA
jgi:small subunit ribosomal protein S20